MCAALRGADPSGLNVVRGGCMHPPRLVFRAGGVLCWKSVKKVTHVVYSFIPVSREVDEPNKQERDKLNKIIPEKR